MDRVADVLLMLVIGLVAFIVGTGVGEVIHIPLKFLFSPVWRLITWMWGVFVRSLDGVGVLVLWVVTIAGMTTIAVRVPGTNPPAGVAMLSLAAFMVAPVIAMAATLDWRDLRLP